MKIQTPPQVILFYALVLPAVIRKLSNAENLDFVQPKVLKY